MHNHLKTSCVDDDAIHIVENRKRLLGNSWYHTPKPLLLNIFQYLSAPDLIKAGLTCSTWQQISTDEFLWRDLLRKDFGIDTTAGIRPGKVAVLIFYCEVYIIFLLGPSW